VSAPASLAREHPAKADELVRFMITSKISREALACRQRPDRDLADYGVDELKDLLEGIVKGIPV
jgi:hypothetical protein